jgi:aspartate racemase
MGILKTLGVLGGMGPMASAFFYELLVKLNPAGTDAGHPDVSIISKASTPDRSSYILDRTAADPMPYLCESIDDLKRLGVDYIACPCLTSHYFLDGCDDSFKAMFVSMIDTTAESLAARGVKSVGLMATHGLVKTGFLQDRLLRAGIQSETPDPGFQDIVTALIFDQIKAGKPADQDMFNDVSEHLVTKGARSLILGCTELSLCYAQADRTDVRFDYTDPLTLLARKCLELCGVKDSGQ